MSSASSYGALLHGAQLHVQESMYRTDHAHSPCDDSIYYSPGRLAIMRLLTRRQLHMLTLTGSANVRQQCDG